MRILALGIAVLATAVGAQPKCPFDAKIAALATDAAALESVAKLLRVTPAVKQWIQSEARTCKTVTTPRLVRVLEGLSSQRCAAGLVELQLTASECKEVSVRVGGGPQRMYALIVPDSKGSLRVQRTEVLGEDPFPAARTATLARVECGSNLVPTAGGPDRMRAIVANPDVRFDGCILQGVEDARVRQEVEACLAGSSNANVTVRFFERDAASPTCVVITTESFDDHLAVVQSGALVPHGPEIDSGYFFHAASVFFEETDAGATWLCAELGLKLGDACKPPKKKEALIARARELTGYERNTAERHDVAIAGVDAGVSAIRLERLVMESGFAPENEAEFAAAVQGMLTSLAACSKNPAAYDGLNGGAVIGANATVASVLLGPAPNDDECVQRAQMDLRKFRAKLRYRSGLEFYRFRMRAR